MWRFRTEATPVPKPAKGTTPDPTHNATEVSRTTNLEWTAATGATSYDVYLRYGFIAWQQRATG